MSTIGDEVNFDWGRRQRIGIGEAVLAKGKSFEQLAAIAASAIERDASVLFTRLDPDLAAKLPGMEYHAPSRTGVIGSLPSKRETGTVAIVTAGTSDAPAAWEAQRTLAFHGHDASMIFDVGVAGLHRLLARLEEIERHKVVIAVAGMDAALASVVAGQVSRPVIGVPTSTGYGVARGGETALSSMLASCAAGLSVVNIDNGFGAACAALRILRAQEGTPGQP
ncbi:nickel pincer cofactor biosynthesis protein LarB [Nitratireductor sp. CH_MIT9313-5]|uniref:nickel pincer cofactor biosynthesis protein LarB n=1 Tax=Nitratireductor sp. CH_MIT9313-5 TaxID=3107764 RepID=UPI00300BC281